MPKIQAQSPNAPRSPLRENAHEVAKKVLDFRDQASIFDGRGDGFDSAMSRSSGESHLEAAKRLFKRSGVHLAQGALPDMALFAAASNLSDKSGPLISAYEVTAGAVVDVVEAVPQGAVAITQLLAATWHLAAAPFDDSEG